MKFKKDSIGNVLIIKPAHPGYENIPTIVLQGHVDMVCEKNNNVIHDFMKDPIRAYIDGDWVKAIGTTLGADDGIGVATMLAILEDKELEHGSLECLFTVDEESGLTGAFELSSDLLTGKTLINLDSEDEGELFIGCAGGIDTFAKFTFVPEQIEYHCSAYKVSITGLLGGHSGDEIHKELGNAIKLASDFLMEAHTLFQCRIARFEGGNLKNAIPRESSRISYSRMR